MTWALYKYSWPGPWGCTGLSVFLNYECPVFTVLFYCLVSWTKKNTQKWKLFCESYETGWHCFGVLADNNLLSNVMFIWRSISDTQEKNEIKKLNSEITKSKLWHNKRLLSHNDFLSHNYDWPKYDYFFSNVVETGFHSLRIYLKIKIEGLCI